MAQILSRVALGELIRRCPDNTELFLSDKAKEFLDKSFTGTNKLNCDDYVSTKDGHPDTVNAWAKEKGIDLGLEGDYAMAAILEILVEWATKAKHDLCQNDGRYYEGAKHPSASRTYVDDLYSIPVKQEGIGFYVSERGVPLDTFKRPIVNRATIGSKVNLIIPQIDLKAEEDFTDEFSGSQATHNGEMFDVAQVKQITTLKMDLIGAEVKQAAGMAMVFSGCLMPTPTVRIDTPPYVYVTINDELAIAIKTELEDLIFAQPVEEYNASIIKPKNVTSWNDIASEIKDTVKEQGDTGAIE